MRLSNVDSVCSVSNLAVVGEESALLAPQGVALPRLVQLGHVVVAGCEQMDRFPGENSMHPLLQPCYVL